MARSTTPKKRAERVVQPGEFPPGTGQIHLRWQEDGVENSFAIAIDVPLEMVPTDVALARTILAREFARAERRGARRALKKAATLIRQQEPSPYADAEGEAWTNGVRYAASLIEILREALGVQPTRPAAEACPCESPDVLPGPHLPTCPWSDPNYDGDPVKDCHWVGCEHKALPGLHYCKQHQPYPAGRP